MSSFDADVVRSGTTANLETLIALLEGKLAVGYVKDLTGNGYSSYASGTTATLATLAVTCEADELIAFYTEMQCSCSVVSPAPAIVHIRHKVDSTALGADFFTPMTGYTVSSTGTGQMVRCLTFWQGLSGAKNFLLQWQNDGAGTIYSVSQQLHAVRFKNQ